MSIGCPLLGMGSQFQDVISVFPDGEVESPIAVDASLPNGFGLIEFLGAK